MTSGGRSLERSEGGRTPDTDRELWAQRAREGDTEAFGRLVETHAADLRASLRRFARDPDELEDLVQDSFVRAWEALSSFDPTRPFAPWLVRIGVRLALDRRRAVRVRPEGHAVDEAALTTVGVPPTGTDGVEAEELRAVVEEELATMPAGWADVLRLRALEELAYAEIAAILEIPEGTVMSRLHRARARIAVALASRYGPPPEASE